MASLYALLFIEYLSSEIIRQALMYVIALMNICITSRLAFWCWGMF
jgi:hypothetical protein